MRIKGYAIIDGEKVDINQEINTPPELVKMFLNKKSPSQKEMILESLKIGLKLTVLNSIEMFGCYALRQRIGELKREGHQIKSKLIKTESGKHVSVYWMD
jgi:hypothetical protein